MKYQLNIYKILSIVAILLLVKALSGNPYSYYIFLRWALLFIFSIHIYRSIITENRTWLFLWLICLILYNPIISVHLTRGTWSIINILTIILFLASLILRKKQEPEADSNILPGSIRNRLEDKQKYLSDNIKKLLK